MEPENDKLVSSFKSVSVLIQLCTQTRSLMKLYSSWRDHVMT